MNRRAFVPAKVEFHEIDHTYWTGSTRLGGTTEIITSEGLAGPGAEYYRDGLARRRGRAVHDAIHKLELALKHKRMDASVERWLDALHPEVGPRVRQYVQWRNYKVKKVFASELLVARLRPPYFAGTLDQIAEMKGVSRLCLWDFKTSAPPPGTCFQLAAYAHAAREKEEFIRGALILDGTDGPAREEYFESRSDLPIFLAATTVFNAKRALFGEERRKNHDDGC